MGEKDMDKNEVLKILETAKDENGEVPMQLVRQAFKKLPEPCEDAVSRAAVIDLIEASDLDLANGMDNQAVRSFVKMVPPVTPKQKTGKWIHEIVNNYTEKMYCSECGEPAPLVLASDGYYGVYARGEIRKTHFCPNCGAEMEGTNENDIVRRRENVENKPTPMAAARGNTKTGSIQLIIRLADNYGVPIDDAFDLWVEANGNFFEYEKLLENWCKEL